MKKHVELLNERNRDEFIEPSKLTTGAYLDEWVEIAVKPRRAANTYELNASIIKHHLKPAFGDVPLQKLNTLHLERYYSETKLSAGSLVVHQTILSSALKAAVRKRLIRTNAASDVSNKPHVDHQGDRIERVWSAEETQRFMRQ